MIGENKGKTRQAFQFQVSCKASKVQSFVRRTFRNGLNWLYIDVHIVARLYLLLETLTRARRASARCIKMVWLSAAAAVSSLDCRHWFLRGHPHNFIASYLASCSAISHYSPPHSPSPHIHRHASCQLANLWASKYLLMSGGMVAPSSWVKTWVSSIDGCFIRINKSE